MNIGHSSHDQSVVDTLLIGCHKIQTIPALEVFVVRGGNNTCKFGLSCITH